MEYLKDFLYVMRLIWQIEVVAAVIFLVFGIVVTNAYRLSAWVPIIAMVAGVLIFTFVVWAIMRWCGPSS